MAVHFPLMANNEKPGASPLLISSSNPFLLTAVLSTAYGNTPVEDGRRPLPYPTPPPAGLGDERVCEALANLAFNSLSATFGRRTLTLEDAVAALNVSIWSPLRHSGHSSWHQIGHAQRILRGLGIVRPSIGSRPWAVATACDVYDHL